MRGSRWCSASASPTTPAGLYPGERGHGAAAQCAGADKRHACVAWRAERLAVRHRRSHRQCLDGRCRLPHHHGNVAVPFNRAFADTTFQRATQQTELSFAGVGAEVGVIRNFGPGFSVAATARSDGHASVDRDSTPAGTIDLPYSFGSRRPVAGPVQSQCRQPGPTQDLVRRQQRPARGGRRGVGRHLRGLVRSRIHAEPAPSDEPPTAPRGSLRDAPVPARARRAAERVRDIRRHGISVRAERAGLDFGLEHVWRAAGAFSERTFLLNLGVTVRP